MAFEDVIGEGLLVAGGGFQLTSSGLCLSVSGFSAGLSDDGTSHRLLSPRRTIVGHGCRQPMLCATHQDVVVSYAQCNPVAISGSLLLFQFDA